MIKKIIKTLVELSLTLNEKEYCEFVGYFYACAGENPIEKDKAESFLKLQMSLCCKEECQDFKIIEIKNYGKRLVYIIELTLQSSYEFSKNESDFRNNVYRFFSYSLYHRNHDLLIKKINYFDTSINVKLNQKYYMVLNKEMEPIYEPLTVSFNIGKQKIDRLFSFPEMQDENGNFIKPKTPKEFYDYPESINDMSGYIVCSSLGLVYFLYNVDIKKVDIYECMCGGDCIDISSNLKRFETVKITKKLTIKDIKSEIDKLNLPYNFNTILFYDTALELESGITEDIRISIRKYQNSIVNINPYDLKNKIVSKLSVYFNDPFISEAIVKLYQGYKPNGLYKYINNVVKLYCKDSICYDYSIPQYLCLSYLMWIFTCINFDDICSKDFKLGADFINMGILPIYYNNKIIVCSKKRMLEIID